MLCYVFHPMWLYFQNFPANTYVYIFINPKKTGFFGRSRDRGEGGRNQDALVFELLHCHFTLKSIKYGLKWKLTSLPICRVFDHFSLLNSLVVRGHRSSLVWSLAFGTTIFENSWFFTYIGNMYIKWKLKTFQIRIWHEKI